jgi:hypothetical protein
MPTYVRTITTTVTADDHRHAVALFSFSEGTAPVETVTKQHNLVLQVTFNSADVDSMADDAGVDRQLAAARAHSWASAISDTLTALGNEQLASVVEHDTP